MTVTGLVRLARARAAEVDALTTPESARWIGTR